MRNSKATLLYKQNGERVNGFSLRINISLDKQTLKNGTYLARMRGQSVSAYVRMLIDNDLLNLTSKEREENGLRPVGMKGVLVRN